MDSKKDAVLIVSSAFADVKTPEIKKDMLCGHMNFGEKNDFPEQVLEMLNKSAKHGAIVGGKVTYIYGGGLAEATTEQGKAFRTEINGALLKKIIFDIETHGGAAVECLPKLGGGYKYSHMSWHRVRSNEENTLFYYKKNWKNRGETDVKKFPAFYPGIKERSIFYFKEYRPGIGAYPLPGYFPSANFIMADIEVSKHTYSNAKNGFAASKMISFFNGEPTEEGKRKIEDQLGLRYEGAEAKRTIVSFNDNKDAAPQIDDLGASDLTKEDFTAVDNLITSNVYAGHQVTNPMLFGIQTPGKLGGGNELAEAYEIFNNTYAKFKREQVEGIIFQLGWANGLQEKLTLVEAPPVGFKITDSMVEKSLTKNEIRERIGLKPDANPTDNNATTKALNALQLPVLNAVLATMTENELRALGGLLPTAGGDARPVNPDAPAPVVPGEHEAVVVNEHIKNLTGRQRQNMLSIVKKYKAGTVTREMAAMLLTSGLGFTPADIEAALGPDLEKKTFSVNEAFGVQLDPVFMENFAANLFDNYGNGAGEFVVISSTKATFNIHDEVKETFAAGAKLGAIEKQIVSALESNGKLTREAIADQLQLPIEVIKKAFSELAKAKIIKAKGGAYEVLKKASKLPTSGSIEVPKIEVRYSYEVIPGVGAEIKKTTRPFCKKMCELNRLYLRADIEKISQIVGYSVWDRRGGFWRKPDGSTSESCRHYWKMNIVTKK